MRRVYEAWKRGDLESLLDHIATGQRVPNSAGVPRHRSRLSGAGGLREFWITFREPWTSVLIEVERIEAIGDDQVLALIRFHGRGRQGVEVSLKWGALMTVEGGMMTRLTNFADWQGALEAAGLSE